VTLVHVGKLLVVASCEEKMFGSLVVREVTELNRMLDDNGTLSGEQFPLTVLSALEMVKLGEYEGVVSQIEYLLEECLYVMGLEAWTCSSL
jgi:hypothetical protein